MNHTFYSWATEKMSVILRSKVSTQRCESLPALISCTFTHGVTALLHATFQDVRPRSERRGETGGAWAKLGFAISGSKSTPTANGERSGRDASDIDGQSREAE